MAHFKRGKCRRHCPRAIRGSSASWRARHGLTPARVALCPDYTSEYQADRGAWFRAWAAWARQWHHPYLRMMSSYPAHWDRLYHVRPKRRAARRLEQSILRGAIDPDDIAWPLSSNKPHIYYW